MTEPRTSRSVGGSLDDGMPHYLKCDGCGATAPDRSPGWEMRDEPAVGNAFCPDCVEINNEPAVCPTCGRDLD